jgi:hypothetical protein
MISNFPNFVALGPRHRARVAEFLRLSRRTTCDLSLTNIYAWQDCETPMATLINGNLCILIKTHREPDYFLEPLGDNRLIDTAQLCLKHAGRISRAGESFLNRLPQDQFQSSPLPDHFDYVFEVKALAELKGKKFDGKRNQIRKFIKNQPGHSFVPLRAVNRDQALALFDRWAEERQNGGTEGSSLPHFGEECQKQALERAFDAFTELGLTGGAILVDGEMQGFVLGSEANPEMGIAHFQYANSKMPGIYQLLLQRTCQEVFASYPYINLEEDLGIPGLRKTKLSYQPARIEKKYLITSK